MTQQPPAYDDQRRDAFNAAMRDYSRVLAARYGISRSYIHNLRNLTWRKRRWV